MVARLPADVYGSRVSSIGTMNRVTALILTHYAKQAHGKTYQPVVAKSQDRDGSWYSPRFSPYVLFYLLSLSL